MSATNEISSEQALAGQSVVGVLMSVADDGSPMVSFPGETGLTKARSALSRSDCAEIESLPVNVLLSFEQGDRTRPVVTGVIQSKMYPINKPASLPPEAESTLARATVDGKSVTLKAQQEIKLECGASSILLRRDGKIIIKGGTIISRSSGANKIRGGSVSIN